MAFGGLDFTEAVDLDCCSDDEANWGTLKISKIGF